MQTKTLSWREMILRRSRVIRLPIKVGQRRVPVTTRKAFPQIIRLGGIQTPANGSGIYRGLTNSGNSDAVAES